MEATPTIVDELAALKKSSAARQKRDAETIAELRAACREVMVVVDECYEATGHIRVAKTSEQRMRIEAAIAKAKPAVDEKAEGVIANEIHD